MATQPATAAITAEMAGAAAARLRAVSRNAIRGPSGSEPPSFAISPTSAGVISTRPSSAITEAAQDAHGPRGRRAADRGQATEDDEGQAEHHPPAPGAQRAPPAGQCRDDVLPGGGDRRCERGQDAGQQRQRGDQGERGRIDPVAAGPLVRHVHLDQRAARSTRRRCPARCRSPRRPRRARCRRRARSAAGGPGCRRWPRPAPAPGGAGGRRSRTPGRPAARPRTGRARRSRRRSSARADAVAAGLSRARPPGWPAGRAGRCATGPRCRRR